MYSREIIDEVISRNEIVDVISGYIKLKKNGNSYKGLCPFHSEKSPSFSVSPQRQLYHCFGCGVGGNVITFVMEYENFTFLEAVKMLGERAGLDMPEETFSVKEKMEKDKKSKILEINKIAATWYYKAMKSENGVLGYQYLKNRGLSDETINRFGLGYSPQGASLYRYLKDMGYQDDILKETGLFTYEKGVNDKFFNRVMFPIMDTNSKVIAFGGRVMGDAKPKYLNSPETIAFSKSRNLYGLNVARTSRKDNIIICEGYMDVIALHQAGFTQAVASLGTSLTMGHIGLIKKYVNKVYITYDSDEAGVKAAIRAIELFRDSDLQLKVVNMRPYKDPDEFIKNMGAEAFQERLDNAQNSFMYEISIIEKKYNRNDPEEATRFEREIAVKLVEFKERIERDNYLEAVCREYGINKVSMSELVGKYGQNQGLINKTNTAPRQINRKKRESGVRQAEKLLLTWIIDDPKIFGIVKEYITPEDFIDSLLCEVAKKIYEQYENDAVNPALIINEYDTEEEHNEVAALFSADLSGDLSKLEKERALNEIVVKVKDNSLDYIQKNTLDPNVLQDVFIQKSKLKSIHIQL